MQISNRKLYLYYRSHEDQQTRLSACVGRVFADSAESLLQEGRHFDEVMRDTYMVKQLEELLSMEEVVEFLLRCWAYSSAFYRAIWSLQNRRKRERQQRVEIEMF